MNDKEVSTLAWVLRGSQRRIIITRMDGFKVPAQLFKEASQIDSKITRNSVSDVLRAFTKEGIAKCINPEERKGRIYVLTPKGKTVRKNITS